MLGRGGVGLLTLTCGNLFLGARNADCMSRMNSFFYPHQQEQKQDSAKITWCRMLQPHSPPAYSCSSYASRSTRLTLFCNLVFVCVCIFTHINITELVFLLRPPVVLWHLYDKNPDVFIYYKCFFSKEAHERF
jgi:hypothetical protein